jgi:tetratricopeptide (TPR) repeat protein
MTTAAVSAAARTDVVDVERALALHRAGRHADAAAAYAGIPDDHPHASTLLYLRAGAVLRADGPRAAGPFVARAARLDGLSIGDREDAVTYLDLGERLRNAGRPGEAVACLEIALQLDDRLVAAYVSLGLVYASRERKHEAAMCFQSALYHDPHCVPALLNLGTVWRQMGRRDSALPCYRLAAKLAPDRVEAHFCLGTLLCELRELDEAIAVHRCARALAPDHPGLLSDLGSALVLHNETEEGLLLLRRAIAVAPQWPIAHVNLGIALARERRLNDALEAFRVATDLEPDFAYARFCESNVHLMRGDFTRGYALYDAHRVVYPHRYRERRWEGRPLEGRTILLYAQHGLGDTLQFVRYVSRVAAMGGRVTLQVQPQLLSLLGRQPGATAVVSNHDDPGPFDVQASLLELPAILEDTLDTIPAYVPYLYADPERCARWSERLSRDDGFKIGVAWHGNPHQKDGLIRRCALRDMAPVWNVPGVSVYSLQVGTGREELTTAGADCRVHDLGDLDGNGHAFMDTSAIMTSLDLIVTIDTSVAHLAAGLGRPVWMVVPYWTDWRWMLERPDSPWYPTMRIFRQPSPGAWASVFAEVATALRAR